MGIVAFVSSHGFGHSVREIEVLRHIPTEIDLTVVSGAPEWFWREELKRPFAFLADALDIGCLQIDSLTVDADATARAWRVTRAANAVKRRSMSVWLEQVGARAVVSDVPSFPIAVAAERGIPTVCVANFTWADIYAEHEPLRAAAESLEAEYARTDLLLDADLSLPMAYFPRRERVGLVARRGVDRRAELLAHLGVDDSRRLALVYAGNWGMPFDWSRLAEFADWRFLTLAEVDAPGVTRIARSWMPHPDLVASVDLVVSKAGYGMVGECLAAGTPLLYGPRTGFAEFAALDAALQAWPGGIRCDHAAFTGVDWGDALESTPARGAIAPRAAPGGPAAAEQITRLARR